MKSEPFLRATLLGGTAVALLIGVVGGGIGWLAVGMPGLIGGLLGAALGLLVMGLTAASAIIGGRISHGRLSAGFMVVFFGTMLLKFALFFAAALWLHAQSWVDQLTLFLSMIVAVLGSLVVDAVAQLRSRIPYVDVELPEVDGERPRV